MTINPALSDLLDEINLRAPAIGASGGPQLREEFNDLMQFLRQGSSPPQVGAVHDKEIDTAHGGVRVRVYEPLKSVDEPDVVVFIHGGGWVIGDLESADHNARALVCGLRARVVSVDYRLAPEHPFPAAFDDCNAVVEAVHREPHRWLGVAGDSAGGNLAAVTAAHHRDIIDAQLLFYPAFDPSQSQPSHHELGDGYLLTRTAMGFYWESYLAGTPVDDPRITPAVLQDLRGLPPTVLTTAGYDPLRDEGQEYAARLVAAGVTTTYLPMTDLIHGWLDMTDRVPAARRALDAVIDAFAALRDRAIRPA